MTRCDCHSSADGTRNDTDDENTGPPGPGQNMSEVQQKTGNVSSLTINVMKNYNNSN